VCLGLSIGLSNGLSNGLFCVIICGLAMNTNSDYLIIGAGINGMLTARFLAQAGKRVTLIDQGEPGGESSWAGGGIVSPLYPWRYSAAVTALATWAQEFYPALSADLLTETGVDAEHRQTGLLMLDANDQEEALAWAGSNGRVMEKTDPAGIKALAPALAGGFREGLWMPRVANIRNPRLCQALAQALQDNSRVTLLSTTEATGFDATGGTVDGVHIKRGDGSRALLKASCVIVCSGAWSAKLLATLGVDLAVHPVKGEMLLYKFPSPPIERIVLTRGRYLIPRADGHLLAGSTLEYADFDKTTTASAHESLSRSAVALLPMLHSHAPVQQWAGLRPGSGDGVPFIGRLKNWDNLFVNAGQFRNGLVLAPASARLLCDLVLGRQPIIDAEPYAPDRSASASQAACG